MTDQRERELIVFLLGAGFSTAFDSNLPTMPKFWKTAENHLDEHQKYKHDPPTEDADRRDYHAEFARYYDSLSRFRNDLKSGPNPVFERDWNNLEKLFTQADLRRMIGHLGSKQLCRDIAWATWDTYARFDRNKLPDIGEICDRILGSLELFPAFITTNYDLLLEWALWTHQMKSCESGIGGKYAQLYYPGFQNFQSAGPYRVMRENDSGILRQRLKEPKNGRKWQIPVIKLHGSVSWFVLDDGRGTWIATSKFGDRGSEDRYRLPAFQKEIQISRGCEIDSPAIIPPTLGKTALHSVISKQWAAAVHCLQRARHVVVIGYSFTDTDAFMPRLLTEGIHGNTMLERITVVDKSIKTEHLERIFAREASESKVRCMQEDARIFVSRLRREPQDALNRGLRLSDNA